MEYRPPSPALYSLGYQLRSVDEFVQVLSRAGVDVVVDVREVPWSRKPGFSKTALEGALEAAGIAYEHARFAGNPKALRRAADSHEDCLASYAAYLDERPDLVAGLDGLVGEHLGGGRSVCLVCYERHPHDCHRSILIERLRGVRQVEVVHLDPEGAPRLSSLTEPVR